MEGVSIKRKWLPPFPEPATDRVFPVHKYYRQLFYMCQVKGEIKYSSYLKTLLRGSFFITRLDLPAKESDNMYSDAH